MQEPLFSTTLASPDETAIFARRLGEFLRPGDTLLLSGQIGAGKSHFARSLIQSLQDQPEDVPSPTFTLIQTYATRKGEVFHADLYRLTGPEEIEELGLMDALGTAISIIEWPDRLGEDAPMDALTLEFEPAEDPDTRRVTAIGARDVWQQRLRGFGNE